MSATRQVIPRQWCGGGFFLVCFVFFFLAALFPALHLELFFGTSGSSEGKAGQWENYCPRTTCRQQQLIPSWAAGHGRIHWAELASQR